MHNSSSYSAHQETEKVLRIAKIEYDIINPIPNTCLNRKIKKPDNPTHAAGFAIVGVFLGIAGYGLKKLLDDDKK